MKQLKNFFLSIGEYSASSSIGLLILRVLVGLSLSLNHGWGSLSSLIAGDTDFPDPIGFGSLPSKLLMSFSEFVCALLVLFGFFTRLAAVPIAFGFTVAFFIFHSAEPFHHKELAYLYWAISLAILFCGPGLYSFDRFVLGKKQP